MSIYMVVIQVPNTLGHVEKVNLYNLINDRIFRSMDYLQGFLDGVCLDTPYYIYEMVKFTDRLNDGRYNNSSCQDYTNLFINIEIDDEDDDW